MSIVSLKSIHALFFYWLMLQCIEQCKHIHSTVHLCFHGTAVRCWLPVLETEIFCSSRKHKLWRRQYQKLTHITLLCQYHSPLLWRGASPVLKGWSLQSFHSWLLLTLKLPNFTHSLEGHYLGLEKSSDFTSSLFTSLFWPDHLFLTSLSDLANCGKAAYCWHNFYQPLHDQ